MHDAQELTELIKDTPNMIARHRVHAEKGGVGYSDTPTVGGFEPSLPMAYDFMDAADMEAAWLGNVMKHCVNMGAIPPLKFEPFHDRKQDRTDRLHGTWWGRGFWWPSTMRHGRSSAGRSSRRRWKRRPAPARRPRRCRSRIPSRSRRAAG